MDQVDDPQPDHHLARRRFVKGAAVAGAATWTAPLVFSATAAAQGSDQPWEPPPGCVPVNHILRWNDQAQGAFTNAVVDGITFAASWTPSVLPPFNPAPGFTNQAVLPPQQGGTGTQYLRYIMSPENTGGGQAIKFTFDLPVRNVVFTILDLDNQLNPGGFGWSDRVEVHTAPFTATPGAGAVFTGDGSYANPYANVLPTTALANSTLGNLRLRFPGPLTTIDLRYVNGSITGGGNQLIGISDVTFVTCAP